MQYADLFAHHPPDREYWLDQHGQVGSALNELIDPPLELHRSHHPHLSNGDGLRLQQLAVSR
jgi:hypothetical protein